MKIQALVITCLLVVFGIFAYIISDTSSSNKSASETAQSPRDSAIAKGPDIPATVPEKTFTVEEVAMHSTEDDCWTIINDLVFDITPYIPRHPGGDEILRACGVDGSSLFNARVTSEGEKVGFGDAHSQRAAKQLSDFIVGSIEK